MSHEVVQTRGGAWAMRSLAAGEVMHPGVGPLAEARQLYVEQSQLSERLQAEPTAVGQPLVLFDVGLGAGSNAVAAWATSEGLTTQSRQLELVSFERDLGALTLALEHGPRFGLVGGAAEAARTLLAHGRVETDRTLWRLCQGDVLEKLAQEATQADIVYWDPFSPRANPELWTVTAFATMRARASDSCTLYTYSASTTVRAALLLAGWNVGVGSSIGDKAETTAAAAHYELLQRPLDRSWLARVTRSGARLPADAEPDAVQRLCEAPQFARRG